MNKKQKKYQITVDRQTEEVTAIRVALMILEQQVCDYPHNDSVTQTALDALNRLAKSATETLLRIEERLQSFGHRRYCNWKTFVWKKQGERWIEGSYTIDVDGDGWFHYRVTRYTTSRLETICTGRRRKRKDVKKLMLDQGWAEDAKLIKKEKRA